MASWDNKENMVYKSQSLDDLTMLGRKDSIGLGEYKNMIRGALSEENLIEKRTSFFAMNEEVKKKFEHSYMSLVEKESIVDIGMFCKDGHNSRGTLYGNGQFSFEDSKTKTDNWMMNDEYSLKWELFWSNQKSTFYDKKATVGFDNKEGNVLEEGDERKMIDIVEKNESKKDEQRKDKKVEKKEKNNAKYAAKLMREHLKLEKKIIKREEKEKKRMKKAELKLANKQGRESKEAGYRYYELLVDGKCKAKEEKKKVKEEMKKAKEQRKLAEEDRKMKLDELKKEMKKRENEEKEKKKQEKERKKEELLRAKEIHAAFLKEKKRKDKQWKLGLRRGDNKERVKELREEEAKKMTNEEIFMASSVKRKLEELSKGKSSQFRKPFVAWGDNVCNENVQDNVKSFKNQISKRYELRGQWDDVIEISYCNDV